MNMTTPTKTFTKRVTAYECSLIAEALEEKANGLKAIYQTLTDEAEKVSTEEEHIQVMNLLRRFLKSSL
jgi:hypothetical protein